MEGAIFWTEMDAYIYYSHAPTLKFIKHLHTKNQSPFLIHALHHVVASHVKSKN
jgi:hypothetical protein